tara:strand:+ start:976 stop:2316 length:1341 start_codon:yes stop_codon:yes gene_type:complete
MKNLLSFFLILLLVFLNSCSFDRKTGIWKEHNKKIIEEAKSQKKTERIFEKNKIFDQEITSKDIVVISEKKKNKDWLEDNFEQNNDVPHLDYQNNKNSILKSKKIGKNNHSVETLNLEPLVFQENIFFSDLSGNIYNYSADSRKLLWKFNFYKKKFKNIPIKINLKIIPKNLIVSDSLGYFYNINIDTGKLVWAKNQGIPLTSEIKSYNEKLFMLNQDNKFYIFEKNNGKKILDFETFPVILKKNNKQTLALDSRSNLYFVTSAGQIFSVNHQDYKINWLKNIEDTGSTDEFGLFYSSPVIVKDDTVYLSSSQATMSLDSSSGTTKWKIPFGTKIRPIISGRFIFLVSKEGFILNVDNRNGKIAWSKKIFKSKEVSLKKMGEITSLLLISDQLFLTTKNGYFFFLNYKNGEIIHYAKVAKGFYSRPAVGNGKIYIIDKNMRVLIFN